MTREQHRVLPSGTSSGGLARPTPGRVPARLYAAVRRRRRWLVPVLVALLLAQMAAAMVTAAERQTPTIDEPVYVATATDYVREHRLRYNPEHPPLGKLLIAAGVVVADPHYDPSYPGSQGEVGRHLLYESGNDPWRLMLWARLPIIALTLLFGLVAFAFARGLAGTAGGLVALALYAFSPDVIAHGSLATLDVPTAGFVLTSTWLVWRARRRPVLCLPLCGAALGAAVATKMSALAAVPVVLALAALSAVAAGRARRRLSVPGADSAAGRTERTPTALTGAETGRRRRVPALLARVAAAGGRKVPAVFTVPAAGRRRTVLTTLAAMATVALAAVAVVWAAYLAVDPRLRFTPAQPVPALHGLRGRLVDLLPVPEAYRAGMRVQFDLETHRWQGYLFGHLYTGSRWYYLPAALLVKTPLGLLALGAAGAVAIVAVRRLRPAAAYVLLPPLVLLAVAMTGARDFGTRYALFVPMFFAVAAACTAGSSRRWAAGATVVLVLCTAVSSLRTFPYYLPYANEAFGGPARTHLLLHDSNVDWGQDLGRLADRLRQRYPGERVWLVYKGSGVPSYYGIRAADPRRVPPGRVRGLLVVSDSAVAKARGKLAELIDSSRPVGEVGHSISIYRR
ncbi:phospholipid carrier-dependent glycosyltransferase [Streptomyces pluripotens]|uniref:Phospholipid carrier-dependent glycosyltransferase n=1 Tax=Streptomyces pluripotens TaxID=1355015 RepID=A0A221NT35_9ACTN|nr:phospholipid carrier-dependent glycosyltransferase [Streptomyces pluripotens]ARP68731.1 phospholipid carrier-dependent glycosyltransferase [Streptomyces pluripotens]ASN22986.1 phospholipid carrier-dependent glycosyltransferase [Streptomyces pluripotens]